MRRMVDLKMLSAGKLNLASQYARFTSCTVEEALVELGYVSQQDLDFFKDQFFEI